MNKQIILSDAKKKELAATFKVSRVTVWAALNFHTDKGMGPVIRKAALERGGQLIGEIKCPDGISPDFTTEFHTSENLMIQTFSNRVKIVAELEPDGELRITADEETVVSYKDVLITQLPAIQKEAQHLANQLKA